ncbi:MAG: LysM peptidoglycan-binding domain-containing protein, partial [Acidimicrobiia bacterium]|nr:LysM peptidoglycan-binding domain-containing protein [Acidimicrobiia bacterium]
IAEDTLGNGRRWNEIQTLNAGRTMNGGHRFTETTDTLTPGWQLLLPADANATDELAAIEEATTEVTVEVGDAFWSIAQTALADAWGRPPSTDEITHYWHELVDTNRDRLAPPYDPDLIYPGQVFALPPVASDPRTETTVPPPAESTTKVTVAGGDTFWSIAESSLTNGLDRTPTTAEVAEYWRELVDANRERLAPPYDPDLIYPGQVFELPAIPGKPVPAAEPDTVLAEPSVDVPPPSTSTPDPTPPDATPPTTVPAPATTTPTVPPVEDTTPPRPIQADDIEPADNETADDTADAGRFGDLFPIAARLAGLGILGVGVVALLRRLRAGQLRHRQPGTTPTPPPAEARETEATIRAAAAPTATEFVDIAVRAMIHDVTAAHQQPPHVVGVHLTPHTLQLLLWTPHTNPPPGWTIDDDGRTWTLPASTDPELLRRKAARVPAPYPTLVTVGHTDDTHLLLDLEFAGATRIAGDPDDLLDTCATIATELATTPLADGIQIMCVGFGDGLEQLERITVADSLTDVLPILEAKTAAVEVTATTPLDGRLSPINDGTWDPIIVLDPAQEAPDGAERLLAMAQAGRGVAALVGYPTGDRWQLQINDNSVRIEPLGQTFDRRNLTADEQTALADLVTAAKDTDGIPAELVDDPLADTAIADDPIEEADEPVEQTLFHADSPAVEGELRELPEMKLLGTLRVEGSDRPFPLRKCTELVAYLTFHRSGVEPDTLMEALWPEQPPDNERLNRHTSRTRTTLGTGPDGEPYVPYITDGRYRISKHLRSDLEHFTNHIRQADKETGDERAGRLHAALELVEGAPFSGAGNAYTWAHIDGIITHSIVAIDNAAHRLAEHALDNDDPDEARWAARKGLLATGACEACYRNLMRAAAAEGNQVAFEATYKELLAVLDADDGPDASAYLDPETIDLYEQERRRGRRQAG